MIALTLRIIKTTYTERLTLFLKCERKGKRRQKGKGMGREELVSSLPSCS